MKNEIVYFFDPICGWCYGFSNHMSVFYEKHADSYDFRLVTGGMARGEHAGPIGEKAGFLKDAFPRVEEMSGVKFGEKFFERLEEGNTVYGSDVPSLVFHALVGKYPDQHVHAAKAIQTAIYGDGIAPMDLDTYGGVARQFNFSLDELKTIAGSEETNEAYVMDLYTTQQFGISGFPFALVALEGEYYQLAKGFRTHQELDEILDKALEYHASRNSRDQVTDMV